MRLILILVYFTCMFGLALPASAQTSIAVVDIKILMTESLAAQSIESQAKARRDVFVAELTQKEKALRESEAVLLKEKASLPQDDFAQKARDFETRLIETRKMAQERKQLLDQASDKAYEALRSHILEVVQAIADEKGHQLVISRDDVVIGQQSLDITALALQRLNASTPAIELDSKTSPQTGKKS